MTLSFSCIFHYGGQEEHREYTPSGTLWVVPDPPLALGMKATWVLPPDYTSSPLLPQRTKHFPVRTDALSSGHNIVYSVMHVSKLVFLLRKFRQGQERFSFLLKAQGWWNVC